MISGSENFTKLLKFQSPGRTIDFKFMLQFWACGIHPFTGVFVWTQGFLKHKIAANFQLMITPLKLGYFANGLPPSFSFVVQSASLKW